MSSGKDKHSMLIEHLPVAYAHLTELQPEIVNSTFDWIGTYGRVALAGESIRFEQYSEMADRRYEITAFSNAPGFLDSQDLLEKYFAKPASLNPQQLQPCIEEEGWSCPLTLV